MQIHTCKGFCGMMVVMNNLNTTIKHYTSNEKCFQLQIPMNFEFIIPDNDSVRLLSQFVEEMDLTCLYDTYSILKENQVTPRQMLKILLYAYLDTKYASRVIETACKRDVNYMYLLEGKPAPNHATIARFRSLLTYQNIVADAGYESEENYSYLKTHGQLAYIKPANYEISKTRKYQNDIANRENMVYEKEKDCYYCSQGKALKAIGTKARKTATGYVSTKTLYCCEECTDCPVKSSCIKGNHWKIPEKERYKTLEVARKFEEQRAESLERITSKQGILLRINRSIQAEGSFAALKWDRGFKRFLCRGESNVYAECVLLAVSHNIGKLHSKIQSGKTGSYLHCENKVA